MNNLTLAGGSWAQFLPVLGEAYADQCGRRAKKLAGKR